MRQDDTGRRMILAPLWSVNDALATWFSQRFYGALLRPEGPAPLAEAVRRRRRRNAPLRGAGIIGGAFGQ